MELPNFDNVKMTIPLREIFSQRYIAALSSAKNLYLALGGRKSSECLNENSSLTVCAEAISQLLLRLAKRHGIKRYTSNDSPMDEPFPMLSYNIFTDKSSPEAILNVEFHFFHVFYLAFLDSLKKSRPEIYKLMRMIVSGIGYHMFCETTANVFEQRFDAFELEELKGMGEHEAVKEVEREYKCFLRHIKFQKFRNIPLAVFIKKLQKKHKEVRSLLGEKEEQWINHAIEMFKHAEAAGMDEKGAIKYRYDDSEDGDRIDLNCCFNLLWKESSYLSESILQGYEAGDIMAPIIRVAITTKEDVEKFMHLVKMFYLFSKILLTGGEVWK